MNTRRPRAIAAPAPAPEADTYEPRSEADTAYQYPARGPVTPELFARFGPR